MEKAHIILSMVHSSLSSFAVVSLSVAASLLETFPYGSFQWSIPLSNLSPSSPWQMRERNGPLKGWYGKVSKRLAATLRETTAKILLSSFAVVSLSVAAKTRCHQGDDGNGPFLSMIFCRRLPERGSESFRGFSISSFQWSIPLSSFAVVSLSVAASLLEAFPYHPFNGPFLSLIFRRRLPERGSESFRDFSISSFQWSIPLSHLSPSSPRAWQRVF